MFSLRAVTRSLPRASPRLASYSSKAIARTPVRAALRFPTVRAPNAYAAAFSTSSRRCDSTATELKEKLRSELQLEQEGNDSASTAEESVQDFLDKNDFWTLHSPEGESDVMLSRKFDDEDITVAFSIDDFNSPVADEDGADPAFGDEEEGFDATPAVNQGASTGSMKVAPEDSLAPSDREGMEDADDMGSQHAFPVNVTVLIQRAGKGAMRANLVADEGEWNIASVSHIPASVAGSQTAQALLRDSQDSLYAGPPYEQLDDAVQEMLAEYFEARGINSALAVFVPDYIDVKEQREYQGWLERIMDFVD